MQYNIEIDIGRGKGYPQTDSDPHPCTTQIRASVLNNTYSTTLASEQCSSIQRESNAPFYKGILKFLVDGESVDEMILLVKVIEFTREPEPFVLFYGKQLIRPSNFRTRKEVTVPLSTINPADSEEEETEGSATLSMRLIVTKNMVKDTADLYADVDIEDDIAYDGTCSVVPTGSTYFWFHLLTNKRWNNSFREALIATWRPLEPLEKVEKPKQSKDGRLFSRDAVAMEPVLHSIGDVVTKKWCCRRTHQILTRLRICGEKFFKKGVPLVFTTEEEIAFRTEKKKRAQILLKMAQDSLTKSGSSKLRDWMERLWVLYAVGIDNDPSGPKTLNYDIRKKVYDTPFDDEDVIVLQSCLIYFFVPSLQFEFCQRIVEEENRILFDQSEVMENTVDKAPAENSGKQPKITPHQERFTSVLMWIVGSMLDTLTEVELLRAVKAVKPAVWDAQQRVSKGGKIGIKERIHHGAGFRSAFKGEGINIPHLDKLGNRKRTAGV